MGPLPPPLAALERSYLVLRARVDAGELSVAEAAAALSGDVAYDSDGARWRVDPAASPAHRAVFLMASPGGGEHRNDPGNFPLGPPRPPDDHPAVQPAGSAPSLRQATMPSPDTRHPRRRAGRTAAVLVAALCGFVLLRGCLSPDPPPVAPGDPPGLQPLPED